MDFLGQSVNFRSMSDLKRVTFYTLGCRLNIAETGSMAEGFAKRGFEIVPFGEETDFVVINTCTVTNKADSECRNVIRKSHRISPDSKIVVVGCYAQLSSDEVAQIDGVDLILGTSEKHKIFDYIDSLDGEVKIYVEEDSDFHGAATHYVDKHTRAFLKVQDGCNYYCTYCIIPFARGGARSIKIMDAVKQTKDLVKQGFKEITLAGINIGEFSGDSGELFEDLVDKLLEVEGLERLRLSSVEPNTMTPRLIGLFENDKRLMPHFHIPIQSGDDEILTLMKRKYLTQDFKKLVNDLHQKFPMGTIGTDIVVGFPGETEEHFESTKKFMASLPITHFHVFPYSIRKGTIAADMENQIRGDVKKARVKELTLIGKEKFNSKMKSMIGKRFNVLFETTNKDGLFEGFTENYIKVVVHSSENLKNKIVPVLIDHIHSDESLLGII